MIRVEGLGVWRGGCWPVRGCDLHIPAGEHWVLAGPSGAGKTTLLRAIAGLESPSEGIIEVLGRLVAGHGVQAVEAGSRGVGMMFQDLGLWAHLNVVEHLDFVLRGSGCRRERVERRRRLVTECHLEGLEKRLPGELSGGEQQRLAVARCLAPEPACLLLDEPLASLDPVLRREIAQLLLGIRAARRITMLTVTHFGGDVGDLQPDRVAAMESGRIVGVVTPSEIAHGSAPGSVLQHWRETIRASR